MFCYCLKHPQYVIVCFFACAQNEESLLLGKLLTAGVGYNNRKAACIPVYLLAWSFFAFTIFSTPSLLAHAIKSFQRFVEKTRAST